MNYFDQILTYIEVHSAEGLRNCFDNGVDPMMGLLPQFQRNERDIYEVVGTLMRACYDIDYRPWNVPNKYLVK